MRKFLLSLFFFLIFSANVFAALSDFGSREWWSNKSGITTGTINDIQYKYLGTLGYTGTLNTRLRSWLADQTGLSATSSLNYLIYQYFAVGTTAGGNFNFIDGASFNFVDGTSANFVQ